MRCILILFFTLECITSILKAQQNDAVFTIGINIEKKFTKKMSLSLFNQYGFNENGSEPGYIIFDGGVNYRINRNFSIGANYRLLESRNLNNFYEERQFLYGDISFAKSKGRFSIALRTRYLTKYYSFNLNENAKSNKHYLRNKATIKYALNENNTVFFSEEQIFRFDTKNQTEQWRSVIGLYHSFNLKNRIELTYAINQQVNNSGPDTDFISGVTYYFKF